MCHYILHAAKQTEDNSSPSNTDLSASISQYSHNIYTQLQPLAAERHSQIYPPVSYQIYSQALLRKSRGEGGEADSSQVGVVGHIQVSL